MVTVWMWASCLILRRQLASRPLTESLDRPDFDSSHGFFDRPHIYEQMTTSSRYHSSRLNKEATFYSDVYQVVVF